MHRDNEVVPFLKQQAHFCEQELTYLTSWLTNPAWSTGIFLLFKVECEKQFLRPTCR